MARRLRERLIDTYLLHADYAMPLFFALLLC